MFFLARQQKLNLIILHFKLQHHIGKSSNSSLNVKLSVIPKRIGNAWQTVRGWTFKLDLKVFVTAVIELINSGSGRPTGVPPSPQVLTGSEFGFSIKRRTEDEKDRRKHGVQLIQDEGTTADWQLTEPDRAVSRFHCSSMLGLFSVERNHHCMFSSELRAQQDSVWASAVFSLVSNKL